MTRIFQRWSKKQRAAHEAKKAIIEAALSYVWQRDTRRDIVEAQKALDRLATAARKLKKAREEHRGIR